VLRGKDIDVHVLPAGEQLGQSGPDCRDGVKRTGETDSLRARPGEPGGIMACPFRRHAEAERSGSWRGGRKGIGHGARRWERLCGCSVEIDRVDQTQKENGISPTPISWSGVWRTGHLSLPQTVPVFRERVLLPNRFYLGWPAVQASRLPIRSFRSHPLHQTPPLFIGNA